MNISQGGCVRRRFNSTLVSVLLMCGLAGIAGCSGGQKNTSLADSASGDSSANTSAQPMRKNISDRVIEIKDKLFIAQTNDIYLNQKDYLGRTIKLEGMFRSEQFTGEAAPSCFVLRYGPGCCGSDGNVGFEVMWDAPVSGKYPEENDWVEAVGELKTYEADGYPYLYISLSELAVLNKRGSEFVSQ